MDKDDVKREEHKRLRRQYRDLFDELCDMLYSIDPGAIGSAIDNPFRDEYAPEACTILPRMAKATSLDEVREIVCEEFNHWFGSTKLTEGTLDQISEEIWDAYKRRTEAG